MLALLNAQVTKKTHCKKDFRDKMQVNTAKVVLTIFVRWNNVDTDWEVNEMTIGERYAKTKGWTARHIVQDEMMAWGKNAEWPEWLEARVQEAELKDSAGK